MLHFHKTNEIIIVVGGGVSTRTYNFMFYVNVHRLNKCQFKLILCVHMLFSFFVANAIVLSRVFRGHWSMC